MPKKTYKGNKEAKGTETFSNNKSQFMKNINNFSSKGLKQMPQNATFGKMSKTHA